MDVDVRHLCVYVGGAFVRRVCAHAGFLCLCVCKCAWRAVWCVSECMCSLGQGWAGCQRVLAGPRGMEPRGMEPRGMTASTRQKILNARPIS